MSQLIDLNDWAASLFDSGAVLSVLKKLVRYDRVPGSASYKEAAEVLAKSLRAMGLDDVAVTDYPINGLQAYLDWIPPAAWDYQSGTVSLVSPVKEDLLDIQDDPVYLTQGSPVSSKGVFELVNVGGGDLRDCYDELEIRGKIVLASGDPRFVYPLAVEEFGAKGVLSSFLIYENPLTGKTKSNFPDMVSCSRVLPRQDMVEGFCFSISGRMEARLLDLLSKKTVSLSVNLSAGYYNGKFEIVSAYIPGKTEKEIILTSHLCHRKPGANDNAGGPAVASEVARVINKIQSDSSSPFEYGIRLIFMPEFFGTAAWLNNPENNKFNIVGVINMDMVVCDPSVVNGKLIIDTPPRSVSTPLAEIVEIFIRISAGDEDFPFSPIPFMGASDHLLYLDSSLSIPAVALGFDSDPRYHTNHDTLENVSEKTIKIVGQGVTASLMALSSKNPNVWKRLAYGIRDSILDHLENIGENVNEFIFKAEVSKLGDLVKLIPPAARCHDLMILVKQLESDLVLHFEKKRIAFESAAFPYQINSTIVSGSSRLLKIVFGPLCYPPFGRSLFFNTLSEERRQDYINSFRRNGKLMVICFELLNCLDGILDLHTAISRLFVQYGHTFSVPEDADFLVSFLEDCIDKNIVGVIEGSLGDFA